MEQKPQGILTGAIIFIAGAVVIGIIFLFRKSLMNGQNTGDSRSTRGRTVSNRSQLAPVLVDEGASYDPSLQISMSELLRATDNFSPAGVIGDGSFGLVYKARLSDGVTVAIKKLSSDTFQGFREFRAEMDTLGRLRHKHIAKILGYCAWGEERVLVYEFVEQGSLDQWLHEISIEYEVSAPPRRTSLTWRTRLKIVKGIARGLRYLHSLNSPVIHRDIKSSNVLLDQDFEAHITDFGLARMVDSSRSHVSTQVAGTMGYMPPEYTEGMTAATVKADVYSFGTLMIEIATGRRPSCPVRDVSGTMGFVQWARKRVGENTEMEMLDPDVERKELSEAEVVEFFRIACMCTDETARSRPTMVEVVDLLDQIGP